MTESPIQPFFDFRINPDCVFDISLGSTLVSQLAESGSPK